MKKNQIFVLFFCLIFCIPMQIIAEKTIVKYYEPSQEELVGVIKNLTFPGPPNYEDIKNGDLSEKCPYLILDSPIDVITNPSIPIDARLPFDDEKHVQLVQLAISKAPLWKFMKDGMRVKVKGEMYKAHTGHHHTRVLMFTTDAKPHRSKPKFANKTAKIICPPEHGFCEVEIGRKRASLRREAAKTSGHSFLNGNS